MKKALIILFTTIIIGINVSICPAQIGYIVSAVVINGDTMLTKDLPMIIIKDKRTFKSKRQAIKYNRLVRNVKKVFPYSQVASSLLNHYNDQLAHIENTRERRKLMKKAEKELTDEYGYELKQLTWSQGIILIKLIDRETKHTSYELVKDLRGGFSAFFWQSLARLFRINLKTHYNVDGDDQKIEDIVLLIKRGKI